MSLHARYERKRVNTVGVASQQGRVGSADMNERLQRHQMLLMSVSYQEKVITGFAAKTKISWP